MTENDEPLKLLITVRSSLAEVAFMEALFEVYQHTAFQDMSDAKKLIGIDHLARSAASDGVEPVWCPAEAAQ
jgi:hypothetical protein